MKFLLRNLTKILFSVGIGTLIVSFILFRLYKAKTIFDVLFAIGLFSFIGGSIVFILKGEFKRMLFSVLIVGGFLLISFAILIEAYMHFTNIDTIIFLLGSLFMVTGLIGAFLRILFKMSKKRVAIIIVLLLVILAAGFLIIKKNTYKSS